jgi:hypothetical protein
LSTNGPCKTWYIYHIPLGVSLLYSSLDLSSLVENYPVFLFAPTYVYRKY